MQCNGSPHLADLGRAHSLWRADRKASGPGQVGFAVPRDARILLGSKRQDEWLDWTEPRLHMEPRLHISRRCDWKLS